jgi:uncharacterized protein YdaU (DUF1376 family)
MKRLWLPLYVADYRADTAHLGALEHGVYLLLIMHYWLTGGLPDDDRQLARIACASDAQWRRCKPVIAKFFAPGWKHGRIDKELARATDISDKRRGAAVEMHRIKAAKASAQQDADTEQVPLQPQLQSQSPSQEDSKKILFGGSESAKGWTPPPHGATGKGRIYIRADSQDWALYAEDFRAAHGEYPTPNPHGGRWFRIVGEQTGMRQR